MIPFRIAPAVPR